MCIESLLSYCLLPLLFTKRIVGRIATQDKQLCDPYLSNCPDFECQCCLSIIYLLIQVLVPNI